MLGLQPTYQPATSGRAPVHRQTSGLFPTPAFLKKSPSRSNVFGGISSEGSHGWVVSDNELFVYDLLASEDGPRRKAELALDLQEDEECLVHNAHGGNALQLCTDARFLQEKFLCVREVSIRGEPFLAASARELRNGDSTLLLFDLRSCKVCTTIKLPYSASAILQLDDLAVRISSFTMNRRAVLMKRSLDPQIQALQEQESILAQFASILVLGTTGGHLLAIDLEFVCHVILILLAYEASALDRDTLLSHCRGKKYERWSCTSPTKTISIRLASRRNTQTAFPALL